MIAGVEIGGTKLQIGVRPAGEQGRFKELVRHRIQRSAGAHGILRQIETTLGELIQRHGIRVVGVGFGGPVSPSKGVTLLSHQVEGWDNFDLSAWFQQRWAIPVVLDNDCNVAAVAEARLGAGRGLRRVFYATVGTGIGGGFVIDGQLDGQGRPAIAEIGHMRPSPQATHADETVESIASGLGIERRVAALLESPDSSSMQADVVDFKARLETSDQELTASFVAHAAAQGNRLAINVLRDATTTLGWALAQATTLVAPERIVIGGGVSQIGDSFLSAVREAWKQYVFPPLALDCDLVPAALGDAVVIHGAMLLAEQQLEQSEN